MTNAIATALNDGTPAIFTPADTLALLNAMDDAAANMGVAIGKAETEIAESAKTWGCHYLNLVKLHGIDGDTLAERTRTRLGWKSLAGEAGTKVKQRFNTWRSNVGVLSGRWSEVDETTRNELLGGTRSFITVYKTLIDADKKAKREKEAAEAAALKALEVEAAKTATEVKAEPFNVTNAIELLTLSFDEMGTDEMASIQEAFAAMVNAYDARVNALLDAAPMAEAA